MAIITHVCAFLSRITKVKKRKLYSIIIYQTCPQRLWDTLTKTLKPIKHDQVKSRSIKIMINKNYDQICLQDIGKNVIFSNVSFAYDFGNKHGHFEKSASYKTPKCLYNSKWFNEKEIFAFSV